VDSIQDILAVEHRVKKMDLEHFDDMMDQLFEDWAERYEDIFNEDQIKALSEMLAEAFKTCMTSMGMDEDYDEDEEEFDDDDQEEEDEDDDEEEDDEDEE
jgi:threonine synthase